MNQPELLADALRYKARSLDPDQDVPEAVPFLQEALVEQRKIGTNSLGEGDILRQLGGALASGAGTNVAQAEGCLREALKIHEQALGTNDFSLAQDWFNLSQIAVRRHDYAEAERDIRRTLEIAGPSLDRKHQSRIDYTAFLAHYLVLQNKWDEAEALLKKEAQGLPDDPRYHYLLGTFYARKGSWQLAADELLRGAKSFSDPNYVPLDPIVALLKPGRTNECITLWRDAMARSGSTRQFDVADKLAKAGLMLPLASADFQRAAALADYASSATRPSWLVPWMQFVKAFADFRRGDFPSGESWAQRCRENENSTAPCRAGACFVHALALAQLGKAEAAGRAFDAGNHLIESVPPETGNFEGRWAPWTIAGMLRDEAAQKLAGVPAIASAPSHP
jgi:tetratricopeptide (TPR) repeat protein